MALLRRSLVPLFTIDMQPVIGERQHLANHSLDEQCWMVAAERRVDGGFQISWRMPGRTLAP